jgi:hypothetical protein
MSMDFSAKQEAGDRDMGSGFKHGIHREQLR